MTLVRSEDVVEGERQLGNVTRVDGTGVELAGEHSQKAGAPVLAADTRPSTISGCVRASSAGECDGCGASCCGLFAD
jgi:hypothetical protein